MTNKEFEDQKQEIIQEIKELILIPLHPCADVESELIEHEGLISERIKQLQPPNPPTCATCEHTVKLTNCWMKPIIECGNEESEFYCRVIYKPTVCIKHSDYEAAK